MSLELKIKSIEDYKKENGVFFTPDNLSNYLAFKTISYINKNIKTEDLKQLYANLKIIDPACGNGVLLMSIKETMESFIGSKIDFPEKVFYGVDIDKKLILQTGKRILENKDFQNNFLKTDSLIPNNSLNTWDEWKDLKVKFEAKTG